MSEDKLDRNTPPMTEEAAENKAIAQAHKVALQRMEDGSATSQIIIHYLERGNKKYELQMRKLELEAELMMKRIESEGKDGRIEELFDAALEALTRYQVNPNVES